MERRMNDYVKSLREVSDEFKDIIGKKVPVYDSGGRFLCRRKVTGIFYDKEFAIRGHYVFLLDDGEVVVKNIDVMRKLVED